MGELAGKLCRNDGLDHKLKILEKEERFKKGRTEFSRSGNLKLLKSVNKECVNKEEREYKKA